ncbi:MAG TPA: hypothetical protein VMT52_05675 [Planctomycetota bacterium]|nr:hypothetical protein [Planctomycetota bacterium]
MLKRWAAHDSRLALGVLGREFTMSAEAPRNEPGSRRAEAAFDECFRRREAGEELDFEAYCAERSELAAALHALHSLHEARLAADSTVGFSAWLEGLDSGAGAASDADSPDREAAGEKAAPPTGRSPSSRSRYSVRGEVARGGMGAILKVWDADLRRLLAMEVLLARGGSETADAQQLARFLEEAQITGQLDHPGVVPVHDMGVDSDGRVFFTMRLVKGKDLRVAS